MRRTPAAGQRRGPAGSALARSRGFSLIELMIAMTIALMLVAGAIGIVFSIRSSFTTQDRLTQMQENQRFMLAVFDSTTHTAGYFSDPTSDTTSSALPASTQPNPDGTSFGAGQIVSGTSGAASDTLNLRMQTSSGDGLVDCLGNTNTSGASATYVSSFAVNAAHQLTCAVAVGGTGPGVATPLVDNVSAMTILYGVDTDGDGSADTYLSAANVSAGARWQAVVSIRLQMTLLDLVNSRTGAPVNLPRPLLHTINLMNKA